MDLEAFRAVVESEGLDQPVVFGSHEKGMDSVVIDRAPEGLTVYISDERGYPFERTIRTFEEESDAFEYALTKLRQVQRSRASHARAKAHLAAQRPAGE